MHVDTGLYVNAAAGQKEDDGLAEVAFYVANPGLLDDEDAFWAIEAGIEKKWFPLGKTTVYGQYYDYDGGSLARTISFADGANVVSAGQVVDSAVEALRLRGCAGGRCCSNVVVPDLPSRIPGTHDLHYRRRPRRCRRRRLRLRHCRWHYKVLISTLLAIGRIEAEAAPRTRSGFRLSSAMADRPSLSS